MTPEKREAITELLCQRWLDGMSSRDLERFFLDIQSDYLGEYTDQELIAELEDMTDEDEFEAIINEA